MRKLDKDTRGFFRYAAVVTFLALLFLFLKKDNIVRWVQAGFKVRRQEAEIELYQARIDSLASRAAALSESRDTLEKFARENYGFAQPGDDVYIVE